MVQKMKVFRLVITTQRLNKDLTQGRKKPFKWTSNWFLQSAITIEELDYLKEYVRINSRRWGAGETTWYLEYKETRMLVESEYTFTFEQIVESVKEHKRYFPSE